jgi:hypothetical protein
MREKVLLALATLLLSSCDFIIDNIPYVDNSVYFDSPPVKIPNLYLKSFPKERKGVLLNYLASSSEWHVTTVNGSLLALKRDNSRSSCEKPMSLNLPSESLDGKVDFSQESGIFFNFSPEVGMSKDVEPKNRVKENTTVSLRIEQLRSHVTVYNLVVENQDKSLELYQRRGTSEDFYDKSLHNTLMSVSRDLEKLAKSRSINDQEIDPSILPPGSVKYSKNQVVSIIKQFPERFGNDHILSGYANFGKKGLIYVKAIRQKDGAELLGHKVSTNAEYIGWSSNLNRKFGFCIRISPGGTASDKPSFLADIQVWFHPADGSPETMFHQETLRLVVRE